MELKKIQLPLRIKKPILAFGSHGKNTLCFAKDGYAYLSEVLQSLSNADDFSKFESYARLFLKKRPKVIAYDLHQEYQSTKYALSLTDKYNFVAVQHHHAHIASCMFDNGLGNKKVIGVSFDGTGLGVDNKLWGAEFLVCNYSGFKRLAFLKEIPLLGAEMAILEPWRVAALWLYLIYKDKFLDLGVDFTKKIDRKKWRVLKEMYKKEFNSPSASSMGRLFDAVASLVLAQSNAGFEAELAIELEKKATFFKSSCTGYNFEIRKSGESFVLHPETMFKQIVLDLKSKVPKENIAYRFHLTIANMVRDTVLCISRKTHISTIVLSGGVFQNNLLLRLVLDLLYRQNFKVYTHKALSSNDSGISLGQVAVANFCLKKATKNLRSLTCA